jgi:hypothetical protein
MKERRSSLASTLAVLGGYLLFFLTFGITLDPGWSETVLAARFIALATVWVGIAAVFAGVWLWYVGSPSLSWAHAFAWIFLGVGVTHLGTIVVTRLVDQGLH